ALLFFAFTTIMAYYYIAETNLNYMYPNLINPIVLFALRAVLLSIVIFGATRSAGLAWDIGDIGVGLMAWLNIIAILLLHKPALKSLKDFEEQLKAKKHPRFDPKKLNIKNTEAWESQDSETD
ncbi:MAG TPA: alanine:cation symporter family protein, partial [Flavobacteriaceae bacterium]|nr:alanine:cation symporter family protein [Flavobacteriaceae bacterium]